jgi:hypothetical protein
MKKIIASAVGIVLIGGVAVTTASAVENEFGGYWRTRVFSNADFDGVDSSYNMIDTRTRLYYTAKFSDDFKFVNKFEFNNQFGDNVGGDIGADGTGIFRIKNSYADFNLGAVNTKVGIQGGSIGRDFLFSDDFSGVKVTGKFGTVEPSLWWIRKEGEYAKGGTADEDYFVGEAKINLGDMGSVKPYVLYNTRSSSDLDTVYLGVDADLKFGEAKVWGTFIYEGGTDIANQDNKGWLAAGGASVNIVHGQIFYATGDDNAFDGDNDAFVAPKGRSYYWAEILGYGIFDQNAVNGSPMDGITNIFAANVGVKVKPMDKLTLKADVWYAVLAEENLFGEDELGTEVDLVVTYAVMDNLNLDLVGAYLFAGNAVGDEDPVEIGARLSLSF